MVILHDYKPVPLPPPAASDEALRQYSEAVCEPVFRYEYDLLYAEAREWIDFLTDKVKALTEENVTLRQENQQANKEIHWLQSDGRPYNWDDDSLPWSTSEH